MGRKNHTPDKPLKVKTTDNELLKRLLQTKTEEIEQQKKQKGQDKKS